MINMCLVNRQTTDLPEIVEAFKVFAIDPAGKLRSAFKLHYEKNLVYSQNKKITVNDPNTAFYAFRCECDAHEFVAEADFTIRGNCGVRREYIFSSTLYWDVIAQPLVVKPVILTKIIAYGQFERLVGNNWWDSIEATEIFIPT